MPETCIFMIWTPRKSFIRLGQATDQKCHLGLIRLRIFKMRWVSVANDHLGPKLLISDSATRRSLWPLECQPVALDDNEWQISKTLIQSSIQIHGQVSKKSYFDIWHFWKYGDLIIGAGAGAAGAGTFCPEPEPQNSFTRSRSRSRIASPEPEPEPGADQKCHGSASLVEGVTLVGPQWRPCEALWDLSVWHWPSKSWHFYYLIFIFIFECEFGPFRENSGPNPMSFQFFFDRG